MRSAIGGSTDRFSNKARIGFLRAEIQSESEVTRDAIQDEVSQLLPLAWISSASK
jgi:hypothetical protein